MPGNCARFRLSHRPPPVIPPERRQRLTETPEPPAITSASIWHADEAEFDAELSPIALTAVRADGGVDNLTGGKNFFFDSAAIEAARTGGIDLRTAVNSDGHRIRVLSIRLTGVPGYAALQVSRSLADQDLIMAELVRGLLQWGVVFALVLAAVSWWLSGRALRSAQIGLGQAAGLHRPCWSRTAHAADDDPRRGRNHAAQAAGR